MCSYTTHLKWLVLLTENHHITNQPTKRTRKFVAFLNEARETHHGVRACANSIFSSSSSSKLDAWLLAVWLGWLGTRVTSIRRIYLSSEEKTWLFGCKHRRWNPSGPSPFINEDAIVKNPYFPTRKIKQDGMFGGSKKRLLVMTSIYKKMFITSSANIGLWSGKIKPW